MVMMKRGAPVKYIIRGHVYGEAEYEDARCSNWSQATRQQRYEYRLPLQHRRWSRIRATVYGAAGALSFALLTSLNWTMSGLRARQRLKTMNLECRFGSWRTVRCGSIHDF